MSNNVARNVTPQLWHTAAQYRGPVDGVRKLQAGDVDNVVARVAQRLSSDATLKPLVNPKFSFDIFRTALASATSTMWVDYRDGQMVGHLYGALLDNPTHGSGVWIGPDGVSFDDGDALAALYAVAAEEWIAKGANEHFVWTLDDPSTTTAWLDLGFARMHTRGVMRLHDGHHALADNYTLRRGTLDDLALAIRLDDELERSQSQGPSFSRGLSKASQRDDWVETLSDPDTRHFIVDTEGAAIAQCVTFPLPNQRSSFDGTIHLSAVVVLDGHRRQGIARAMVDAALNDARKRGFVYAETNWRITNREAARYWTAYGFSATYVRLHRTIGMY
jgi:ribosomal protein S18 acetylase RimI-like enzyme